MMHDFELHKFFHYSKNVLLKALLYSSFFPKPIFLSGNHINQHCLLNFVSVSNWSKEKNDTETVVKETVLVHVPQIEPHLTSWQYSLIDYLDLTVPIFKPVPMSLKYQQMGPWLNWRLDNIQEIVLGTLLDAGKIPKWRNVVMPDLMFASLWLLLPHLKNHQKSAQILKPEKQTKPLQTQNKTNRNVQNLKPAGADSSRKQYFQVLYTFIIS